MTIDDYKRLQEFLDDQEYATMEIWFHDPVLDMYHVDELILN